MGRDEGRHRRVLFWEEILDWMFILFVIGGWKDGC